MKLMECKMNEKLLAHSAIRKGKLVSYAGITSTGSRIPQCCDLSLPALRQADFTIINGGRKDKEKTGFL